MIIENEIMLDYKDVLLRPKRSTLNSRKEVEVERTFGFPHSPKTRTGIPIMAANMDTVTTIPFAKKFAEHHMISCLHKFYSTEEIIWYAQEPRFKYCAITIWILDPDLQKLDDIMTWATAKNNGINPIDRICIDVANGYTERFAQVIGKIRAKYPDQIIIAWNVVTRGMTEELILSGADIVKVGIGPGSTCITRIQSWVGYPQLSAVIECADAAHGLDAHIIADWGIVNPGDFAKAYGAGADFTMCWGIFAAHEENTDEIIEENGKQWVVHYGMSSDTAMKKHYGWVAQYRSSEGKTAKIPYKGPLEGTILNILWGIRSACTYIGAKRIKDMPKCTTFIRVSQQSNEVRGRN